MQTSSGDQRSALGLGLPIARALANDGGFTYQRRQGEAQFVLRLPAVTVPGDHPGRAVREQDASIV